MQQVARMKRFANVLGEIGQKGVIRDSYKQCQAGSTNRRQAADGYNRDVHELRASSI
jgi:hypothetical protein